MAAGGPVFGRYVGFRLAGRPIFGLLFLLPRAPIILAGARVTRLMGLLFSLCLETCHKILRLLVQTGIRNDSFLLSRKALLSLVEARSVKWGTGAWPPAADHGLDID